MVLGSLAVRYIPMDKRPGGQPAITEGPLEPDPSPTGNQNTPRQ
jgi:hypothetical protein